MKAPAVPTFHRTLAFWEMVKFQISSVIFIMLNFSVWAKFAFRLFHTVVEYLLF